MFLFGLALWNFGLLKPIKRILFHKRERIEIQQMKAVFEIHPEITQLRGDSKIQEYLKFPIFQTCNSDNVFIAEQEFSQEKPMRDLRFFLAQKEINSFNGLKKKFGFVSINKINPTIQDLLLRGFKPNQIKVAIQLNERGVLNNGKRNKESPTIPTGEFATSGEVPGASGIGEPRVQAGTTEPRLDAGTSGTIGDCGVAEQRNIPIELVEDVGNSKRFVERTSPSDSRKSKYFD